MNRTITWTIFARFRNQSGFAALSRQVTLWFGRREQLAVSVLWPFSGLTKLWLRLGLRFGLMVGLRLRQGLTGLQSGLRIPSRSPSSQSRGSWKWLVRDTVLIIIMLVYILGYEVTFATKSSWFECSEGYLMVRMRLVDGSTFTGLDFHRWEGNVVFILQSGTSIEKESPRSISYEGHHHGATEEIVACL